MKRWILILFLVNASLMAMRKGRDLARNVTLCDTFDYENALRELQDNLLRKTLSRQECSRRYTGIYTKMLFIVANIEKETSVKKKYDSNTFSYYHEEKNWEDATVIAAERLSNLMVPPETRMPLEEKLKEAFIRLKLKS